MIFRMAAELAITPTEKSMLAHGKMDFAMAKVVFRKSIIAF